jgi:hypothetical protein
LAGKILKKNIADACAQMGCDMRKLFRDAYEHVLGKRRGIVREAREAHARFRARGTLTSRAMRIIRQFLDALFTGGIAKAA